MMDIPLLPRGITGFAPKSEVLPWVASADLKRMCYAAARSVNADIGRVDDAEGKVGCNFHAVEVRLHSEWAYVLCNAHSPLAGLGRVD